MSTKALQTAAEVYKTRQLLSPASRPGWDGVMNSDGYAARSSKRLAASTSSGPRPARHLVSPNELIALFNRSVSGQSEARLELKVWREIQFLVADFCGGGAVHIPPLAFHAIASVTQGSVEICRKGADAPGASVTVHEGQTIIEAGATPFNYVWQMPHRTYWACISPELVRRLAEQSGIPDAERLEIRSSLEAADPVCGHLLKVLAEEARIGAHATQPLIVESVANALAGRLLTRFCASRYGTCSALGALGACSFRRVYSYMEANLGVRIYLDNLARVAGVSRHHFARQFRLRTGESPMGLLLRLRIERAKTLLEQNGSTMSEVAATLGFGDQTHFTRQFRRLVGITPTEYRNQSQLR
jgi:AraC family transcriptional regulator